MIDFFNVAGFIKLHLKCDFNNGSIMNGIRKFFWLVPK